MLGTDRFGYDVFLFSRVRDCPFMTSQLFYPWSALHLSLYLTKFLLYFSMYTLYLQSSHAADSYDCLDSLFKLILISPVAYYNHQDKTSLTSLGSFSYFVAITLHCKVFLLLDKTLNKGWACGRQFKNLESMCCKEQKVFQCRLF